MKEKWTVTLTLEEYNRLTEVEKNFEKEVSKYDEEYKKFKKEATIIHNREYSLGSYTAYIATKDDALIKMNKQLEKIRKQLKEKEEKIKELEKRNKRFLIF